MTSRVRKLRERILQARPTLCSQRAILVTEAYRETKGEPAVIKRAKVLRKILEKMEIYISDNELIVGHPTEELRGASFFPEMAASWLEEEINSLDKRKQDPFVVSEQAKKQLLDIIPFWKGKTLYDTLMKRYPESVKLKKGKGLFSTEQNERGGIGNVVLNYPDLLARGFKGIQEEAYIRLKEADITDWKFYQRSLFWQAAVIDCEAAINFAHRYSKLAKKMSKQGKDEIRRGELERISKICDWVPANPARTFHEALQSIWFVQLIAQVETNGIAISLGRMDQYLFPFYESDIKKGIIAPEEAIELIECFLIKLNEIVRLYDEEAALINAGLPAFQNITLGGQLSDGEDGTNDLTYMFLDALKEIRLPQSHLSVRVHRGTPTRLLIKTAETIKAVPGMPGVMGDESYIKGILARGVPIKEAYNYSFCGCVTWNVDGTWARAGAAYFNLAKVLELTLNNGVDPLTGEEIGPKTGDLREFSCFEEIIPAFEKQLSCAMHEVAIACNIIDLVHAEMMPHLFLSLLIPDCIDQGIDVTEGGARYNFTRIMGVGLPNVADSLAAIKKLVFEDHSLSIDELIEAIKCNFEGKEELRQILITKAPKYGNDIDFVDSIAKEVGAIYFDEVENYKNPRGGTFVPAYQSLLSNIYFGWHTGATSDGRKKGMSLADTISVVHSRDTKGPTAVLKSASKLDHIRTYGSILNLRFNPGLVQTPEQIKKFSDLFKTYLVELGGTQVQFNIVSAETLREAQGKPEEHRELVVRVTGFSAYFVELSREVQNDIIERTEHARF
ncbi:Choline trimethylamine-lyase [subsurface metagenome]